MSEVGTKGKIAQNKESIKYTDYPSGKRETLLDERTEELKEWLGLVLDAREFGIQPASEDASFRRYFRIKVAGDSYIVMDAPPEKENTKPYIRIAQRFLDLGLNVPEIYHSDLDRGFLLLSDLGSRTYLDELGDDVADGLYGDAMDALIVLQAGSFNDRGFLPPYTEQLLHSEMELFRDWYLVKHLDLKLSQENEQELRSTFEVLCRNALDQPQVWVHRDYHSRNLMLTGKNNPGILDFQDAVLGPVTYDLVSLLKDCYIRWPRERVKAWAIGYRELALESGIPVGKDEDQFLQWFDLMGVQRHLKASGIFARLNHRDGKSTYLNDIPRTLAYIRDLSGQYPVLEPLIMLIDSLHRSDCR